MLECLSVERGSQERIRSNKNTPPFLKTQICVGCVFNFICLCIIMQQKLALTYREENMQIEHPRILRDELPLGGGYKPRVGIKESLGGDSMLMLISSKSTHADTISRIASQKIDEWHTNGCDGSYPHLLIKALPEDCVITVGLDGFDRISLD